MHYCSNQDIKVCSDRHGYKIVIANQECKFIVLVTNEYDIIYTIPDQSMYLLLPWLEDVLDNGFIPKRWCWPADITEQLSTGLFSNLDSFPFSPVHFRRIRTSLGIQCNHAHAWRYDEHVHSNKPPGIWNDFYPCSQKLCISMNRIGNISTLHVAISITAEQNQSQGPREDRNLRYTRIVNGMFPLPSSLSHDGNRKHPVQRRRLRDVEASLWGNVTTPFMLRFLEAMHPVTVLEHWRFFFPSSSPEHSKSLPNPSPWTSQAASRTHFKKPSKSFLLWFLDII